MYKRNTNYYPLFRRVLERINSLSISTKDRTDVLIYSIEDRLDEISQEMSSDHKCSEELKLITCEVVKSPSIDIFRPEVRPAFVRNGMSVLSPQALTTDMGCLFQSKTLFASVKI